MKSRPIRNTRLGQLLESFPELQRELAEVIADKVRAAHQQNAGPALMTIASAAEFLSCSRATIYRLLAANKLQRTYLLVGSPRIRRADLDALVAGPTRPA